jgi:hypothetical protein
MEEKVVELVENQTKQVITQEEFEKLNSNPNVRLKKMEEGVYKKLEKLEG